MPDICIHCLECNREYRVSEYATLDGMTCLTCGAALVMPEAGESTMLRLRQKTVVEMPVVAPAPAPAAAAALAADPTTGEVPVIASIQAINQAGLSIDTHIREVPKWVAVVIAVLVMGAFVGYQYVSADYSEYLTWYIWARNIVAAGALLMVILVAFQDGLGPGGLCLFIPPYTLFYVMSSVESNVLRGIYYGIFVALVTECYLMGDQSILIAMGSNMGQFIDTVDGLLVTASDSPVK